MLIFTIMHLPGLWDPMADLAGLLCESGCLHSLVKRIPRLNSPAHEQRIHVTNSSGYLHATSHQTSGHAGEVK